MSWCNAMIKSRSSVIFFTPIILLQNYGSHIRSDRTETITMEEFSREELLTMKNDKKNLLMTSKDPHLSHLFGNTDYALLLHSFFTMFFS